MRIIAGKHKNIAIPILKNSNYRPSTSKVREALFSILSSGQFQNNLPFKDKKILDVFAGSGSLAFEAISRGARTATLVDICHKHLNHAKKFAQKIGEEQNIQFMLSDALTMPKAHEQYDLVFMDPPYYKQLVQKTIHHLMTNKWLTDQAIIAIEVEKNESFIINTNLSLIKEKLYNNSKLLILRYEQQE